MPKTITETIERLCCDPRKDLVVANKTREHSEYAICVHCKCLYIKTSFRDAAGDTDWEWRLCQ